jgi:hypothetical protein
MNAVREVFLSAAASFSVIATSTQCDVATLEASTTLRVFFEVKISGSPRPPSSL